MIRAGFELGASRLQVQCSHCLANPASSYPQLACVQTPLPSGKIGEGPFTDFS